MSGFTRDKAADIERSYSRARAEMGELMEDIRGLMGVVRDMRETDIDPLIARIQDLEVELAAIRADQITLRTGSVWVRLRWLVTGQIAEREANHAETYRQARSHADAHGPVDVAQAGQ